MVILDNSYTSEGASKLLLMQINVNVTLVQIHKAKCNNKKAEWQKFCIIPAEICSEADAGLQM